MTIVLQAKGLTHAFGDHVVLDDISFAVKAGEAVGVVGPNGSGKTTLLRAVTGTQLAQEGTVELLGKPLDERRADVRRALAVVMDDIDFFPDLSVVEHLDLMARAHGVADAEEVVDALVDEIGLRHVSARLPGNLSSGQRRRMALASALVRPRRLLILDEPEQRLDVDGVAWLGDRLLAEKAAGVAILLVSHDPGLVAKVCDRNIVLREAHAPGSEAGGDPGPTPSDAEMGSEERPLDLAASAQTKTPKRNAKRPAKPRPARTDPTK